MILRLVGLVLFFGGFMPVTASPQEEKKEITLEAAILDRYTGRYGLPNDAIFAITREDQQLFAQITNQPRFPVYPESETRFFYKVVQAVLEFGENDLTLFQNNQELKGEKLPELALIQLPQELLNDYAGIYVLENGLQMRISVAGESLSVKMGNQPPLELRPETENFFHFLMLNAHLSFNRDAEGKITGLTSSQGESVLNARRLNRERRRQEGKAETERQAAETSEQKQNPLAPLEGNWLGELATPGGNLRLVLRVEKNEQGGFDVFTDSPDQGINGIPVDEISLENKQVRFGVSAVMAKFAGVLNADSNAIEGTFEQGGAKLDLTLNQVDKIERPNRPQEPEAPFPYTVEEVSYPNKKDGFNLAGTLTIPEGSGPFPAVVLISGSGPQDRDETLLGHKPFWILADFLTRRGFGVLRFDDRGFAESGGDFASATTYDFAADALAGIAYLKSRKEFHPKKLGLIGHSEGGIVAPIAANRSRDVAFILSLAGPTVPGREILLEQTELISRVEGLGEPLIAVNRRFQTCMFEVIEEEADQTKAKALIKERCSPLLEELSPEEKVALGWGGDIDGILDEFTAPWMRTFLNLDPAEELAKVRIPVFIVLGEKDLQVPPPLNEPAAKRALAQSRSKAFLVKTLPGLNHLFQPSETGKLSEYGQIEITMSPVLLETVDTWLQMIVR